jgi:hypothetical protein
MPETSDIPDTSAQLTASLAGLAHGPYSDASTEGAGELAAETTAGRIADVCVLCRRRPRGGVFVVAGADFWGGRGGCRRAGLRGSHDCVPFGAAFPGRGRQRVPLGAPRDPNWPR